MLSIRIQRPGKCSREQQENAWSPWFPAYQGNGLRRQMPGVLPAVTNFGWPPGIAQTRQRDSAEECAPRQSWLTTLISLHVPPSVLIKPGPISRPMIPPSSHNQRPWVEDVAGFQFLTLAAGSINGLGSVIPAPASPATLPV